MERILHHPSHINIESGGAGGDRQCASLMLVSWRVVQDCFHRPYQGAIANQAEAHQALVDRSESREEKIAELTQRIAHLEVERNTSTRPSASPWTWWRR